MSERSVADHRANAIRYASFKLAVANSLFTTVAAVWTESTKRIVAREALRLADRVQDGDSEYLSALGDIASQGDE